MLVIWISPGDEHYKFILLVTPCSLIAVIHLAMKAADCFETLTGIARTKLHGGKVQKS